MTSSFCPDPLLREACLFYGVPLEYVRTPRRGYVTNVRRAVGYVLLETVGWSVPTVARYFGKDPKAISGGHAQAKKEIKEDPLFFEIVSRLTEMVAPSDKFI